MTKSFEDCLKTNKIRKFSRGKTLTPKEIRLAEEDLKTAHKSFEDKNYKWCIIQIYYSMFHSARALLYFKNLKEHSFFSTLRGGSGTRGNLKTKAPTQSGLL